MNKLDKPTQEEWFDFWADELLATGFLDEVVTHPDVPTFRLFDGYTRPYGKKRNVILSTTDYTPDRILKWNEKARGIFFEPLDGPNENLHKAYFNPHYGGVGVPKFHYSIGEVKGPTGNQAAYGTKFVFTQKWLWANTGQYAQKVMLAPAKLVKNHLPYLWSETFTPERFLYSDKLHTNKNKPIPYRTIPNKQGVPMWKVRSLAEFIEMKNPTIK